MNHKERFEAGLAREPADRPAIMYQHLGAAKHVLAAAGLTMREGFHDPETFARIAIMGQRITGFDNVMAGWGDILVEARAHGMQWVFPERDFYPRAKKYVEMTPSNLDKIVPVDPMKDEYWSVPLKASKLMMDRVGREVEVLGCMVTPMGIVGEIVGLENLLMATMSDPGIVEQLLGTVVESLKTYGEHISRFGISTIYVEDGAELSLSSPENIERYQLASLKKAVSSFHSHDIKVIAHNCAAEPYLDGYIGIGADAVTFHVTAVDLEKTMAMFRGHVAVMAGIDQTVLLFKGTEKEIQTEVDRIFNVWGDSPGFMFTTGCEMAFKTPMENIIAFREAVARQGTSLN
jgi:uroporphyrinogen-III decarboxylase